MINNQDAVSKCLNLVDVARKCLMVRADLYQAVGRAALVVVFVREEVRGVYVSTDSAVESLVLMEWGEAE